MKANLYFTLAASALLLASCAQDDVIESAATSKSNEITLTSTIAGNFSRAYRIYSSSTPIDRFKLCALIDSRFEYFAPTNVVGSGSNCRFEDGAPRYWPVDDSLDFFAFNDGSLETNTGQGPVLSFETQQYIDEQVDLMYASAFNKSGGAVNLEFQHAVCQVVIKIKGSDHMNVLIQDMHITNVIGSGDLNLVTGEWTLNEYDRREFPMYNINVMILPENPITVPLAQNLSDNYSYIESEDDIDSSMVDIYGTFMFIPQSNHAWIPGQEEIHDLLSSGSALALDCSLDELNSGQFAAGRIYVPFEINWEPGKRYIYTLEFGKGTGGFDDQGNPSFNSINVTAETANFVNIDKTVKP